MHLMRIMFAGMPPLQALRLFVDKVLPEFA
jgi:hypothetical protein